MARHLDVYFIVSRHCVASCRAGDSQPFSQRPIRERFFAFNHRLPRVPQTFTSAWKQPIQSLSPFFSSARRTPFNERSFRDTATGLVYGYLLPLLAYNMILYAGLHSARYLKYSAFLTMFILMSIGYTGHGFTWFWPEQVTLQRWIVPILMVLYGTSGLAFATDFLNLRSGFPRTNKLISGMCGLLIVLMAATVWVCSHHYVILEAFVFVTLFSFTMLALGIISLYSGYRLASYFLIASIASMLGTASTTLSTWGYIPFSDWTFRAIEIGMLVDATLLALALAQQFRENQAERILAEQLAGSDPLTGLNKRRAFQEKAQSNWSTALRKGRNVSLIIFNIDYFKLINDRYGHAIGDAVLVEIGKALAKSARDGDVVARWGGEEFLLLLPETNLEAAITLAERLRKVIAKTRMPLEDSELSFTASFGVSQRTYQETLDSLISEADGFMYQAKKLGRIRVSYENQ